MSLITKKGEWEKKYWKQRLKNSLAWDTEKEEGDHLKLEKDKSHRMKVEIMREEDRQMVYMKKVNMSNMSQRLSGFYFVGKKVSLRI